MYYVDLNYAAIYLHPDDRTKILPNLYIRPSCSLLSLKYATAYYGLNAEPLIFETAIRELAEGNSIRSTSRIVEVDKDTICDWLNRAAQHYRLVMLYLWNSLDVAECQLDELWSFVHTKERNLSTAKHLYENYGDAWVWIAFAPVSRLVLAFVIGRRDQAHANLLLKRVDHGTDGRVPFFTSDQLPEYRNALLEVYGQLYNPPRQGDRGRFPKPRLVPCQGLLYARKRPHY